MKRYCVLLVSGTLLAAVTVSVGQAPPTNELPILGNLFSKPSAPQGTTPVTEKGIEELLARLDAIKTQQVELEKAKQELVEQLKKKLRQQKEHIQKLNISIGEDSPRSAAPSPEPTTLPDKGGEPRNRLAAIWSPKLQWGTSTDRSNRHIPLIRGRLFVISEAEIDPGFQDGASVVVDLYRGENRLETWEIGAPLLKKARLRDAFGNGYSLTLPWTTYSCEDSQVRLKVRYQRPGGTDLKTISDPMTLSGGSTEPD